MINGKKIGVVGLGYVGLPLAVAFSRKHAVVGFDISSRRVVSLRSGVDWTNEVPSDELKSSSFEITDQASDLAGCETLIVTVPTQIDRATRPDFTPLMTA